MYKIEQNSKNEIIAAEYSNEKLYEPLMLLCNLKKSAEKSKSKLFIKNNLCETNLKSFEKSTLLINDYYKKSNSSETKESFQSFQSFHNLIINFTSPEILLNASYLLSVAAVISLLNPKLNDN